MNICADAVSVVLEGPEATRRLGEAVAEALRPGDVIALEGELGAGKTEFVRAVAVALGADERDVASPTFVYLNVYEAALTVYHFDAYRLSSPEEFLALGAREFFDAGGVALVEWAERVADALPREFLKISLYHSGSPDCRRAELMGVGGWTRRIDYDDRRPR